MLNKMNGRMRVAQEWKLEKMPRTLLASSEHCACVSISLYVLADVLVFSNVECQVSYGNQWKMSLRTIQYVRQKQYQPQPSTLASAIIQYCSISISTKKQHQQLSEHTGCSYNTTRLSSSNTKNNGQSILWLDIPILYFQSFVVASSWYCDSLVLSSFLSLFLSFSPHLSIHISFSPLCVLSYLSKISTFSLFLIPKF